MNAKCVLHCVETFMDLKTECNISATLVTVNIEMCGFQYSGERKAEWFRAGT